MSFLSNVANLPFLILRWLIETYLLFAAARLIMALVPSARQSQYYYQLQLLTDPLPRVVGQWLHKWGKVTPPLWLSWLIVMLIAAVLHQVLLLLMV